MLQSEQLQLEAFLNKDFEEERTLEFVQRNKTHKGNRPAFSRQNESAGKCSHCGKVAHFRQQCPARDATCPKYQKKGLYSTLSYSKSIADVTSEPALHQPVGVQDSDYYDTAYLDAVGSSRSDKWTTTILIGGAKVLFKLDTGAEVTEDKHVIVIVIDIDIDIDMDMDMAKCTFLSFHLF